MPGKEWCTALATALSLLLAACASQPPTRPHAASPGAPSMSSASGRSDTTKSKTLTGAIEDTYIMAPRQVGPYHLLSTHNYQQADTLNGRQVKPEVLGGVQLRYGYREHDQLGYADIYIYPLADGDADAVLGRGMQHFVDASHLFVKAGLYDHVDVGAVTPVHLDGIDWPGREVTLTLSRDGQTFRSRMLLFMHHLYFVKVRIDGKSTAGQSIDSFVQPLLTQVLPALQWVSVGTCGRDKRILTLKPGQPMPPDLNGGVSTDGWTIAMALPAHDTKASGDRLAKQLLAETALAAKRQQAGGCTAMDYAPPSGNADRAVLHLHYPADLFSSHTH
ncbi:hypothetical protein [Oleiagrimonas sp. C23AA]|uniref:hypothetical protein n=1 Tax=Oleiagrimonas sp. C23AA TaxID=2719047 RepID=UPI001420D0DF|nr:hypothetical protein [Oleiagrimonas sp. C23AA]NII11311.1 hypothetical protein [Oleiagrimonas sp. C23AA]